MCGELSLSVSRTIGDTTRRNQTDFTRLLPRSPRLLVKTVRSPLEGLHTSNGANFGTYLDKRLGGGKEVLSALWSGALLEPVDNSLIRYTILVVQHLELPILMRRAPQADFHSAYFQNVGECLDDLRILVAIHLDNINQGYLSLGRGAKRD